MTEFLYYCRAGYEADLQAELTEKYALKAQHGYAKFNKNSGFLRFCLPSVQTNLADGVSKLTQSKQSVAFDKLIFARQKLLIITEITFETHDRVTELLEALASANLSALGEMLGDVIVEHADSEHGKQLAKFCKKFTVPLRQALRKKGYVTNKPKASLPFLHCFFEHSGACVLALSLANDRSPHALGIKRLKMPSEAPSRSTLKLEEAITSFFTAEQEKQLFCKGMRAVDLGACPGGWTYQLVSRGVRVEAIDNGKIAQNLMDTGLVEHYDQDGFLYQPQHGNTDWLVCDMIEQPTRVGELMLEWLLSGKANAAIFNLKLPMKKRYKVVEGILGNITHALNNRYSAEYFMRAKHLYHNRDEVTVVIVVNSQMLNITSQ